MAWPLPLDRIRVQAPAGRVILAATDKGTPHGAAGRMTSRIRFSLISISSLLVFYILIGGLLGKNNSTGDRTYRDMGVYSEVLSRIKQDYVTEPNLKKVTDGAVRGPRGEPQKIPVKRAVLVYPPAVSKVVDNDSGYIRVATFNKGRAAEIAAKVKELTAGGSNKIVLDLRNCAGGEVKEAVETASLFLDKGLVCYLFGQHYPREDFAAKPPARVCDLPLAVLINQSTAGQVAD